MAVIGGRVHAIEEIHEIGGFNYPFAEICIYDPQEIRDQLKRLLDWKEKYNLYYFAHFPNEGNPFDADNLKNSFVPKIKELLKLAKALDIKKGTLHFWIDKRWAEEKLLEKKIDLLKEMTHYAGEKGVTVCLENLTERFDSFAYAFREIPDLRMTLDIGHGELLSRENTSINFIKQCFDKIEHIHVHDNNGGKTVKDDLHLVPGEGRINFPHILGMLKERNYTKTITMEIKPQDMPRAKEFLEKYLL